MSTTSTYETGRKTKGEREKTVRDDIANKSNPLHFFRKIKITVYNL